MDNTVDISVIVCCYNPDFVKLQRTIMSIVRQDNCRYEIIIADDGSKINYLDELKKWTSKFKDISIKYSLLNSNHGTVTNLLHAVNMSSGSLVKVISPGDYLYNENTLSKFLQYQIKTRADLIAGNFIYYKDDMKIIRDRLPHSLNTFSPKYMERNVLAFNDHFHGAALLVKREVIKYCLDVVHGTVKFAEDISIVNICILENYKVVHCSIPMIWYEFGTGISTVTAVSEYMKKDSDALWELLNKKYSSPTFDKIYHDRKVAMDSDTSELIKILTLKGFLFYTLNSYITFIYKCSVYIGRLINMKKLSNQLHTICSI